MAAIDTALTIAHTGLSTATSLLEVSAKKLKSKATKSTDPAEKQKLLKEADRQTQLARALKAADTGIVSYLAGDEEDESDN